MKYVIKLSAINPTNLAHQYQARQLANLTPEYLDNFVRVHESEDQEEIGQVIVGLSKPFSLEKAQEYCQNYGWELRQWFTESTPIQPHQGN